jgi:hypothetical protein
MGGVTHISCVPNVAWGIHIKIVEKSYCARISLEEGERGQGFEGFAFGIGTVGKHRQGSGQVLLAQVVTTEVYKVLIGERMSKLGMA